jgi:hypothetical protein
MNKDLGYAFEELKAKHGLTEYEMIACWLEFIAERSREAAAKVDEMETEDWSLAAERDTRT